MSELKHRVWGNASPAGKPKIYFTCFPDDFPSTFDKICSDLLGVIRGAVYYTPDMETDMTGMEMENDLEQMGMFVFPVTLNLLTKPNRALDTDLPFALKKHIPVLPVMMERGLDEIYRREDRFGSLHYLSPDAEFNTGLSYEEKLERFLQAVFPQGDLEEQIHSAFDASIFMSYRRMDRVMARKLMQEIHRIPEFESVSIWYDDYLVPGEDFKAYLRNRMRDCSMAAIVVSPNLIADTGNYVLEVEYRDAVRMKKPLLGIEIMKTQKRKLRAYPPLARCIPHEKTEELKRALLDHLKGFPLGQKRDDPLHRYLMGCAYLTGADVEVDRERAVALLTSAGEAGEVNAEGQLCYMYRSGTAVERDLQKEVYWAKRYAEHCTEAFGKGSEEAYHALYNLAESYANAGEPNHELETWKRLYNVRAEKYGENPKKLSLFGSTSEQCCQAWGNTRKLWRYFRKCMISAAVWEKKKLRKH